MSIGNFQDPTQKNETKKVETPASRMVEGIQTSMESDLPSKEADLKKAKDWKEKLSDAGVSLEKAHAIIDDLLTVGHYAESYNLTKRITVEFRTRTQADYKRYLRAVDIINPRYNDDLSEIATRYFLAASLIRYNDKTWEHPDPTKDGTAKVDEAFEERLDWVEAQSGHLITLLSQKLRSFDENIALVLSEGVIENF